MSIANPVLIKEMRARMRGIRAYILLAIYLIILAVITYVCFSTSVLHGGKFSYYARPNSEVGRGIFIGLSMVQMFLIMVVAPAFLVGAITLEREQKTYNLLRATPLEPRTIVEGKLVSSLSYVFLLLISSIPLAFLVSLLGGLAPGEVFKVYAVIMATALSLGMVGLGCSVTFSKTSVATAVFYGGVLFFLIVPSAFVIPFILGTFGRGGSIFALLNPFFTISYIFQYNMVKIFDAEFPLWLISCILNSFFSLFVGTLVVEKLTHFAEGKKVWVRTTFLLFYVVGVFLILGGLFGAGWGEDRFQMKEIGQEKIFERVSLGYVFIQIGLFLLITQLFSFGKIKKKERGISNISFLGRLARAKRFLHNEVYSSPGYNTLLVIVSFPLAVIGFHLGGRSIFEWGTERILLIYSGFFLITLAWSFFSLLLNEIFQRKFAAQAILFLLLLFVSVGVVLPGMPQFPIGAKDVSFIGSVFLHLNPWVSMGSLINGDLMDKITERACGQSPREFYNYALLLYSICVVLSLILTLMVRKIKVSRR